MTISVSLRTRCPECHRLLKVEDDSTEYQVVCSSCGWKRRGADYLESCFRGASMEDSYRELEASKQRTRKEDDSERLQRKLAEVEAFARHLGLSRLIEFLPQEADIEKAVKGAKKSVARVWNTWARGHLGRMDLSGPDLREVFGNKYAKARRAEKQLTRINKVLRGVDV